jgi:hypothetical protein
MPSYGGPAGREQSWISTGASPRTQWPGSYHGPGGFGYDERTNSSNIARYGSQSDSSSSSASTVGSSQYCVMPSALPRPLNSGIWNTALNPQGGSQSQYGSAESSIPQRSVHDQASNWYDYGSRSSLQMGPSLNESTNNYNHLAHNAYQPHDAAFQQQPQLTRPPFLSMTSSYESQSASSQGDYPVTQTKMAMPSHDSDYQGKAADPLPESY